MTLTSVGPLGRIGYFIASIILFSTGWGYSAHSQSSLEW